MRDIDLRRRRDDVADAVGALLRGSDLGLDTEARVRVLRRVLRGLGLDRPDPKPERLNR